MGTRGSFVISLDFELHWGGAEKWDLLERRDYFSGARVAVEQMLCLFAKYDIHATWATVGLLFARNKSEAIKFSPELEPSYFDSSKNYYPILRNDAGEDEDEDPFHFAPSLISKILATPGQELASHTYSHYYCQENGQNAKQFEQDLISAQKIARANFGVELKSLVFPKNQFNSKYLDIVQKHGFKVVRSNPNVWFWRKMNVLSPFFRGADAILPISGTLTFDESEVSKHNGDLLLIPSSRFLRVYTESEKMVHNLKKERIFREMTYAATHNRVYHLWWHPHNFGDNLKQNLMFLEEILQHYRALSKTHGFASRTMYDLYLQ